MRDENMVAECLRHSDTVYNLVGRDFETKLARRSPFSLGTTRLTGWLVHEGTLTSGRRTPLVQRGLPRSLRSVAYRSSFRSRI